MEEPKLISGDVFKDERGVLTFNNSFNAFEVKRLYTIENSDTSLVRRWQGHKIERRWFVVIQGRVKIELICVDDWQIPSKNLNKKVYEISDENFDILYVPPGFISSIQALVKDSKLLAMSDYLLNEVDDNYKFSEDYFAS